MKKYGVAFLIIVLLGAGALYYSQRRTTSPPVSANALVDMLADAQHNVSRIPAHFTRLSDAEEIRIGDSLAGEYASQRPVSSPENIAFQNYVQAVGGRLALKARRPLPYKFHVLADPNLVNSFALPGGHIFIGRGMLNLLKTEDELAAVLGHEIEHVELRHCAERVQITARLQKLPLGDLAELAQIPIAVWQMGYSKDQEFEADRMGTMLSVSVGYSPYGAVQLFEQFQRLRQEYVIHASAPTEELGEIAVQTLQGYFESHPQPSERLDAINRLIEQQGWQDRKEQKPFHVEYQTANTSGTQ